MDTAFTLSPLGAWQAATEINTNLFGDGIGADILDAAGFPICEIPCEPILHDWHAKYPDMPHWADGADDGRTKIERTPEQLAAIARLVLAAPKLLAALTLAVRATQRAASTGKGAEWLPAARQALSDANGFHPIKPLPDGVTAYEPVNDQGSYYAADGTFMNADGTRSIFDDIAD